MKRQYQPAEVLPHAGPMLLLDEIVDWGQDWITTRVSRTNTRLFELAGQTSSGMAAMEYLCQSAAAHAGIRQLEDGKPITIGFIIGARLFRVDQSAFVQQQQIEIHVDETFRDPGGIGLYQCRLYAPSQTDQTIAEMTIKAAMPDDPEAVFSQTMLRPRPN